MLVRPNYLPNGYTKLEEKALTSLLADLDRDTSVDPKKVAMRQRQRAHLDEIKTLLEQYGAMPCKLLKARNLPLDDTISRVMDKCLGLDIPKCTKALLGHNNLSQFHMRRLLQTAEMIPFLKRLIEIRKEENAAAQQILEPTQQMLVLDQDANIRYAAWLCSRLGEVTKFFGGLTKEEYDRAMAGLSVKLAEEFKNAPAWFFVKSFELYWKCYDIVLTDIEEKIRFNQRHPLPFTKILSNVKLGQGPTLYAPRVRFHLTPELEAAKPGLKAELRGFKHS